MEKFTLNFDNKISEVLNRSYPSLIRDEIISMICDENVDVNDIKHYLNRVCDWEKKLIKNCCEVSDYDRIPPFYYISSMRYYLEDNWEKFDKETIENWEDEFHIILLEDNGEISYSKLATKLMGKQMGNVLTLTVGEICQLNNMFLREVMTDSYGMCYEAYDNYAKEHSDEFVGFVEVMACDDYRYNILPNKTYGFLNDVSDGAIAYIDIVRTYNDSFGIKMDVDFACEVAIISRVDESYMNIVGMHIDTLVQTNNIWDGVCNRAKEFLKKHNYDANIIKQAKELNNKRIEM